MTLGIILKNSLLFSHSQENKYSRLDIETKISMKRKSKYHDGEINLNLTRIGFLSDFTLEPVLRSFELAAKSIGKKTQFIEYPTESIEKLILDLNSELYNDNLDLLIIYPDYERLIPLQILQKKLEVKTSLQEILKHWENLWKVLGDNFNSPIYQHDFAHSIKLNLSAQDEGSKKVIHNINNEMKSRSINIIKWIEVSKIANNTESGLWVDSRLLEIARLPFSPQNLAKYIFLIISLLRYFFKKPLKLIISDLDGTLWFGNLAEDGCENLINSLNSDPNLMNKTLSDVLLNLKDSGVLLSICSKNYESEVINVFERVFKFPFKEKDFVSIKVNWDSKSHNIRDILALTKFHPENVIFIDNSMEECVEIKESFPEMTVVHSDEFSRLSTYDFDNIYLFNSNITTYEDSIRAEAYKVNKKLDLIVNEPLKVKNFLTSLKMKASFSLTAIVDIERAEQMYSRTNQFRANLSTFPFSDFYDKKLDLYKLELCDSYTDYGIISLISVRTQSEEIVIDQWLMSCRVFNREIPEAILQSLFQIYFTGSRKRIRVVFQKGERNRYFCDYMKSLGFKEESNGEFLFLERKNLEIITSVCPIKFVS